MTFVATNNSIIYNDAEPIFLDVDLDTWVYLQKVYLIFLRNMLKLEMMVVITKFLAKISACLPMHTFGFPVHIDKLISVCDKWKIPVVEDAELLAAIIKTSMLAHWVN